MYSVKSLMRIYFRILLILISSFYSPHVEGEHQVIGSSQAILAIAGEDVTLPCHIEPLRRADKMTVDWSRPDLEPVHVHVRQQGREVSHDSLNPLYQQRTSLFAEELLRGNISLKLSRVRLSDEGTFKCFVPNLPNLFSSTLIQLRVGVVSQPVISTTPKDDGFTLTCDSGPWYPQPEVSWLDSEGNLLAAEPSETVGGPSDYYTVQRNVTVRGAGRVTCRVHLAHINHTVETHSVIADHNFTQPIDNVKSTQPTSDHVIVIVIVIGSVIGIGNVLAVVGYIAYRRLWRKKAGTSNGGEEKSDVMEENDRMLA